MSRRWLKPLAFALIVFFGFSIDVGQWNKILYSESLSTSLFTILLSLWIVAVKTQENHPSYSRPYRLITFLSLCIFTLLYSFTRDVNGFFNLISGTIMLLIFLFQYLRKKSVSISYRILSILMIITFCVQYFTANIGKRWFVPFLKVLSQRILQNSHFRTFFLETGLPLSETSYLLSLGRREFI
jgi:membrane-associated HD superfamily phosphohydrolase